MNLLDIKDLDKRFYIFELKNYYAKGRNAVKTRYPREGMNPGGGMNDVAAFCDTREQVLGYIEFSESPCWVEVLDRKKGVYTTDAATLVD